MEMIGKYASRSQAEERAAFLRSRGIATHVTDMSSLRLNLAHQGQYRAAVWAMLEPQFDDARALLEDPDHRVSSPLTSAQMEDLETQGAAQALDTVFRTTMLVGVAVVLALLASGAAWMIWGNGGM